MASVDEIASAVDAATLTPVVREIVDDSRAELGEWTYERLAVVSGLPDHRGLFRFTGTANARGSSAEWSTILKIANRHPTATDNPIHPGFWNREAIAFRSGLLAELTGIAAVRCYAIDEAEDETVMFWLADLEDEYGSRWPIERYGLAARHLGQMGGVYLARGARCRSTNGCCDGPSVVAGAVARRSP